jgi:hypothetical protein
MLACHWSRVDGGRLECRWEVECFDDPGERAALRQATDRMERCSMSQHFRRNKLVTRLLAFVLVTLLFCIAVFTAIYSVSP